jgi:hypothetical protein
MPAAADGPRCATWSILCLCRLIARTRSHLDLVAGRDAAHQRRAVRADVLGDGEDRRDVVAGVRVLAARKVSW